MIMEWKGKYFTLYELTRSATAKRMGYDNTPTEQIIKNLQDLVVNVLDPLRLAWGRPIVVGSGYRCPKLNVKVGGAKNSQHLYGQAADIHTVSDHPDDNMELLRLLIDLKLPFDKLISEYVDSQGRPNWIHVSFSPQKRGIKLTCKNGKYYNGITTIKKTKK
jgi:hypothetical protein